MTIDPSAEQAPTPPTPRYGSRLYDRTVRVVVAPPGGGEGRAWTDLRITFGVKRTKSKKPSPAQIQIYNLTEDSRSYIESDNARVWLYAGYGSAPDLIFGGDVDEVEIKRTGRDVVTTIKARDGARTYREGFLSVTYDPPLRSSTLLERIAGEMGIGIGFMPAGLEEISYSQGYTIAGPGRDALTEVCSSIGASWSIQDQELQILALGGGTTEEVFLLQSGYDGTPNTGLVGSPEKTKKGVKARILLNGQVKPGRTVRVNAREIQGWYVVSEADHKGDSGWSGDFYTDLLLTSKG